MTAISRTISFTRKGRTLSELSLTNDDYTISLFGLSQSDDAVIKQRITFDGNSKLLFSGPKFQFVRDDSTKLETRQDVTAGTYNLVMKCISDTLVEITLESIVINLSTASTFASIAIASDNDTITLTFSDEMYAAVAKSGDLDETDFDVTTTGGNASAVAFSSPTHSAGDKAVTFSLTYTGTSDGNEVVKVSPVADNVYNRGSVPMLASQFIEINLNAGHTQT